jgi:signal peptidase I
MNIESSYSYVGEMRLDAGLSFMRKKTKILFIISMVLSIIFIMLMLDILVPMARNDIVYIHSNSMENPNRSSIKDGDIVQKEEILVIDDLTTFVDGRSSDHRVAGSYGDVVLFHPNGDVTKTLIVHRAVICIYFNSSDYNDLKTSGGGYDIPSLMAYNAKGVVYIEDYEWMKGGERGPLRIDLGIILRNFHKQGSIPHSGFITKGDNNEFIDQNGVFDDDGNLMKPVWMDWIVGKVASKVNSRPMLVTTFTLFFGMIASFGAAVTLLVRDLKRKDQINVKFPEMENYR